MYSVKELAARNLENLRQNSYPGRGIVQGVSTTGDFAQVYWVMGRSENSRSRLLHQPTPDIVATTPFDTTKVTDPSLVIYNAMRTVTVLDSDYHIVSNGDHTDKVADALDNTSYALDESILLTSLYGETHEPDDPNFTPRIAGLYVPDDSNYHFVKISKDPLQDSKNPDPVHGFYAYTPGQKGFGRGIHTYNGDGDPLPSFDQEPYILPLHGDHNEIAEAYWDVLDKDNRVALVVKTINKHSDLVNVRIINALGSN